MAASGISESDLAFLQACHARLGAADWRAVLVFAQALSDRVVPPELRERLGSICEGCIRLGAGVAFAEDVLRDAYLRALNFPDTIEVTVTLNAPGGKMIKGVRAETKAYVDPQRRRPQAG
jgi:hypothetical protein